MAPHRYFIKLAYNGSAYHGWQSQKNAPSVQDILSGSMADILSIQKVALTGCGRTDTGVHASEFYAHFDSEIHFDQATLDNLVFRLNRYLPSDIVIFRAWEVDPDLHARFSAISRTYEYHLHTRKDPFLNDLSWFLYGDLDIQLMGEASELLLEYDDFTSFAKLHSGSATNICQVTEASWNETGDMLIFRITADRFLRNMVRAIVGTLVDVGENKLSVDDFRRVIENKQRAKAGQSAPAHGLYLVSVRYPDDRNWPT